MAEAEKKEELGHRKAEAVDVHAAVAAVCPIHGVSIGRWEDKSTWRIHFKEDATAEQRQAAKEVLQAFDMEENKKPEYVGAPRVIR